MMDAYLLPGLYLVLPGEPHRHLRLVPFLAVIMLALSETLRPFGSLNIGIWTPFPRRAEGGGRNEASPGRRRSISGSRVYAPRTLLPRF